MEENFRKTFDKEKFRVIQRQKFIIPSVEIYGGVKGLYDYVSSGNNMMEKIINEWKNFFILKERMFTIECPSVTPEQVLKASGHVDRFNDYIVKDVVTGEPFRADHLVSAHIEQLQATPEITAGRKKELENILKKIDNYGVKELTDIIRQFAMKSDSQNELTAPIPFNLMFDINIGPSGDLKGYLRPETAQGIFVNFKWFLENNRGRLPFAVAQIGTAYRNEIAPRQGVLRVREFKMAEIEHFLDTDDKSHPKFVDVAHLNMNLFTSPNQISGGSTELLNLGESVRNGTIANETLGYFMGRIYLFLVHVGIKPDMLRFRQHMPNEMAHYACDCWDAECLTSYGWIECVGCADRSAYDLTKHSEHSGTKLVAQRQYAVPKAVKRTFCKPAMAFLGKSFKRDAAMVARYIESLSIDDSRELANEIEVKSNKVVMLDGNREFNITRDCFEFVDKEEMVHVEEFVPSVIEPSFGLGRILHSIMEQNFAVRADDADRTYFTFPITVAPYPFTILPLSSNAEFRPLMREIDALLAEAKIATDLDDSSASIGKRYARADLVGIAYAITIDFDSLAAVPSVTVRERDSMRQVRVNVADLVDVARRLVHEGVPWAYIEAQFHAFEGQVGTD